ncbi:MAG: O-antigen ligase family protein [Chitinispirillales bacterium]|jgi:O-antigen ligase|nr:O-antigen ligase family protein [Chitinispirillales bacterium]
MATLSKGNSTASSKNDLREFVVCQIFGLAALALVVYAVAWDNYRVLSYAIVFVAMTLVILKPVSIPYLFVVSLFTVRGIYGNTLMFAVQIVDVSFLLLFLAFVFGKKIDLKAALSKQRALFTILCIFMLWAIVGFIVNFYDHGFFENITSAFFIYKIVNLVIAVILFSQPEWEEHRNKIVFFFIFCVFCQIGFAFAKEIAGGSRELKDFTRSLTGTLGAHHGMLACIMVLSTGVASAAFFQLRDKYKLKSLFSICISFLCAATVLLVSGSRSSQIGMIIAVPFTVFLCFYSHKRGAWPIFLASVLLALTVLWISPVRGIALSILGLDMSSIDNIDMSAYGRVLIWERVYEHVQHGTWLQKIVGIGIGTFNTLKFNYFLEVGMFTSGAHNNFMHVFVETGIIGLIIFLAIFIEITRKLVKRSRLGNNAAKCFLYSTLAMFFSGITQETFWFQTTFGRIWLTHMFFYLIMFNSNNNQQKGVVDAINPYIGNHKAGRVA